jgi:cytochrome c oxidase cbb3-type subunit 1
VKATYPFYAIRLLGGVLYLGGMVVMAWNVARRSPRPRAGRAHPHGLSRSRLRDL